MRKETIATLKEISEFYDKPCQAYGAILLAFRQGNRKLRVGDSLAEAFVDCQRQLANRRKSNGNGDNKPSVDVLIAILSEEPCRPECLCGGNKSERARKVFDMNYHGVTEDFITNGSDNHMD